MASRQELAEAATFRRRFVTASFLQGANADFTPLPRRTAMAVVTGIVVGLLALVGAAAHGTFVDPHPLDQPANGAVLVDRDQGGRYLVENGILHVIPNYTSLLLMGMGGHPTELVSHHQIEAARLGAPMGIVDAPESPPRVAAAAAEPLACAGPRPAPTVLMAARGAGQAGSAQAGILVRTSTDGGTYLVTAGKRFSITAQAIQALNYADKPVRTVSSAWLSLAESGPPIRALPVPGLVPGTLAYTLYARLVIDRQDSVGQPDDRYYVVDGNVLRPVPNATALRLVTGLLYSGGAKEVDHGWVSHQTIGSPFGEVQWPAVPPTLSSAGSAGYVCLSGTGALTVTKSLPRTLGAGLLAPAGATGIGDTGPVYLVAGERTYLVTSLAALRRMGYVDTQVRTVPDGWSELLAAGSGEALRELSAPARS
ncbi:type VII secretion protein EccB [Frankia sp. R82]|uniref:type VII secretion protein EccB n=1 Tax=Frankia sp. R82 TaxID=2950553 RepID=UPI002043AC2B|nr:type VII secretion protein EccB [Frankia sp. R82]MCM3883407.1 type VII secretion protein EccB [Frankia sp. R82]